MIGIIDSGFGGLSVVCELMRQHKDIPFVYFGDNARNPYGTKTQAEITQYACELIDYVLQYDDIQTIIIACNTMCAAALPALRTLYPHVSLISIADAGGLGALMSFNKHVSVLATEFTIKSNLYRDIIQQYDETIVVQQLPAQQLVAMVEHNTLDLPYIKSIIGKIDTQTDTVILGCTHFPFLYEHIRAALRENVQIVDPAIACVAQLSEKKDVAWNEKSLYLTTGVQADFAAFIQLYKLEPLPIKQVTL